jgi:hypothetical protein
MAARQESMNTYLTKGQQALKEKDAGRARRYLDLSRIDVEALEKFLGR